ncbi:hypothetical protein ACLKA7_011647 [Drosophila subpalustris]
MNAAPASSSITNTNTTTIGGDETTADLDNQSGNMDNDDDEPQALPFCFVRATLQPATSEIWSQLNAAANARHLTIRDQRPTETES